ncbi:MAG: hypothetical protein ACR2FG_12255 [Marmoricola sp.]
MAGTTGVVSAGCHGGRSCARVGGVTATNGSSSISQGFSAPAASTSVGFWYLVVCPDTVTYDWATATLRDNTTSTTVTLLPRTCTNNGTWVHVTHTIIAGHSYTISLISRDDNYASDPTYTMYDDVTTQ